MKHVITASLLALGLLAGPVQAADDTKARCERSADEKKLAGAARDSHVKKCIADAGGGGPASAACEQQADQKKLAGAARSSFVKKCVADAGGGATDPRAACERSADEKRLAGAARDSHVKKCIADAGAKK
jgi:hypothetical protein